MASSYIDPSPANFQAFKDLPRDEPIHMLNLLEYREQAEYKDCLLYTSPSPRDS